MKANSSLKTLFGPLWKLYSDPNNVEILVDAFDDVYFMSKEGVKTARGIFKNEEALDSLIKRLMKYSENAQFFKLPDETRINIVLPPIALRGPSLVITKLPLKRLTLDDLISFQAITTEGRELLEQIIEEGKGFAVAGNMGSGKTTLMNILIDMIPLPQRVLTLERFPDFYLHRKNVVRLQAPHQKAHEMVELVEIAERMRADFIILSECSGPEVMPYLDLIRNDWTGAALLKGTNVADALRTLENKAVLSSEGLSLEEVRYAIAQSFKHIIYQERRADGKRVISTIAELSYLSGELKIKVLYKQ